MNHCYRLIWNRIRQCFVVAAENTRGRGKSGRSQRSAHTPRRAWLLAAPLALAPLLGMATGPGDTGALVTPHTLVAPATGPAGGTVTSGRGSIRQHGLTTTIDQRSQNLSLNWQSFDVGAASTVNFAQPNAQSIAVNRIAGTDGSVILGHLNANGQVFLINPNGVLFGRSAQVNVGGLVASTLDMGDGELSGVTRHFFGGGQGSVINQGSLSANEGGYIALLGPQVTNQGTLRAPGGTVAMGGGDAVTLSFDSNRLLSLQVDRNALNALADNRQLIMANGGQVLMSAGAKDALLTSVVNNTGVIQAQTVGHQNGRIVLLGGMAAGTTQVAGTLDAGAPTGGDGGFIETSAAHVTVADAAKVTTQAAVGSTGTWLIDPQEYTIAATGGDITGAALSTGLAGNNVAIQSADGAHAGAGNINLNDAVSWSANNTLTLTASNDVNINANVTATGASAGLVLAPNTANGADAASGGGEYHLANGAVITLSGATPSLSIAGNNYTVINSLGTPGSVTGKDLQGIQGHLSGNYALGSDIDASATNSWDNGAGFYPIGYGGFQGSFDGLGHTITGLYGRGFFATTAAGSAVRNVGLLARNAIASYALGGLVQNNYGTIDQAFVIGSVISSGNFVGGLVADNYGTISRSHVGGMVSAQGNLGGLVGRNLSGATITQSYSSATVSGSAAPVGGLVGLNNGATISQSYATGAVSGNYWVGGLVGVLQNAGAVPSVVTQTWASGRVQGNAAAGGLIGASFSGITASYWDSYSSGQAMGTGSGNVAGLTAVTGDPAQAAASNSAFKQSAYATLDFTAGNGGWVMLDGSTRPFLRSEYSTNIGNAHQLQLAAIKLDAAYVLANDLDASATNLAVNGATRGDAAGMWSHAGFSPIGNSSTPFTGRLDGQGHAITGLTINRPTTDEVGLVGDAGTGSTVRNLGLIGGSTTGQNSVGALVGNNAGTIRHAYATGTVTGSANVGGLVGTSQGATVSQSYATGAVTGAGGGAANVGGLIGSNSSTVDQVYATGKLSGGNPSSTGGLAGANSGAFTSSYWDTYSTGQSNAVGSGLGTGTTALTSDPAQSAALNYAFTKSAYAGFDFTGTWFMLDGSNRPFLQSEYSTRISNVHQLQLMAMNLTASYTVTNDFDASETGRAVNSAAPGDAAGMWTSAGFSPVGNASTPFAGVFDGQSHTITGLTINRPSTDEVGLFGKAAAGSTIRNVGLLGGSTAARNNVGSLVGLTSGKVSQAYATGRVSGVTGVGGLVGYQTGGTLSQSYATGAVTSPNSGGFGTGGLVGASSGTISQSYATGTVSGDENVGGLLGQNASGQTRQSYATGAVSGNQSVGGLLGSGADASGTVVQSYATGAVSGTSNVGGLAGANLGTVTASYWDTQASGQASSAGGTGLTTAQMMTATSFAGWDLASTGGSNSVWRIYSGLTAPLLRTFMPGLVVTASNATATYNGAAFAGGTYTLGTLTPSYWLSSAIANPALVLGTINSAAPAINAGSYALNSGLYSSQMGYDLALTPATLTISPAPLGISGAAAANKTYDGNTTATISGATLNGTIYNADTVTLDNASTGTFADKNAGAGKAVTMAATLSGASATNYQLTQPSGLSADITPASLTVSGITATDKVYDSTTTATLDLGSASFTGIVSGDSLSAGGATGVFDSKNVGTGKTVSISGITLGGSDAGNYTLTGTTVSTTANITPAALTYKANTASTTYGVAATGLNGSVTGFVPGEDQSTATSGTLAWATPATANSNVGSFAINGAGLTANQDNYTFSQAASNATALTINPATLTYLANAASTTYGTAASGLTGSITGFVNGDTQTTMTSGTLAWTTPATVTSNVGQYAINGSGLTVNSANYLLTEAAGNAAALTINPAALTYMAHAATTTYGTAASGLTGSINGFVNGDTQATATSGTLAWATPATVASNAGSHAINGSGLSANNGNYSFTQTAGNATALTINPAALTATAIDTSKTYDGVAYSGGNGVSYAGLVNGESATALGGTLVYSGTAQGARNAGSYVLTPGGLTSTNYVINFAPGTLTVDPAALTISTSNVNKIYDGTTKALGKPITTAGTLFGTDSLSDGTFAFDTRDMGTNKTVNASAVTVNDGNSGNNYALSYAPNTHSSITAKPVSVDITASIANVSGIAADNKVYDGTTDATLDFGSAVFNGMTSGDSLVVGSAIGMFSDKNAGVGKAVFISGIRLGGSDATNYTLLDNTARTTADITPLGIMVAASGRNKVYDGTTAATVALASTGVLTGDSVHLNANGGSFADKNVGSAKPITVSDIAATGADAGNYRVNTSTSTAANITPATLTYLAKPGFAAAGGVPTGLTGAVTGLVGGDTVATATTGTLSWSAPATTSSPVGQYAIDGTGLAASNYIFQQAASNASALQLTAGSQSTTATPQRVAIIVAQLQQESHPTPADQQQDDDNPCRPSFATSCSAKAGLPVPSVRIINGGVRMP